MLKRLRVKARALVGLLALFVAALPLGIALAVITNPVTATYHQQNGQRFQTALMGGTGNPYTLQTNLWNKAVSGQYTVTPLTTPSNTAWSITGNSANSYFFGNPGVDPNNACTAGSDSLDLTCNWAGTGDPWINPDTGTRDANAVTAIAPSWVIPLPHVISSKLANSFSDQIHAPASYADIFRGCHWNTCTPGDETTGARPGTGPGAPFPLQLTGVSRLDSRWTISGDGLTQGVWDASYDIWLDTNTRPGNILPSKPRSLNDPGQNDGAEIMIWLNNQGYNPSNPAAGIITPSGIRLVADTTIPGYILHDQGSLTISITCGGTTFTSTGTVFIDPSGRVFNQATGQPIPNANVTLSRSNTQNGTFATVISSPGNVSPLLTGQFGGSLSSPTTTNAFGAYRWDVAPGWYKVTASAPGCNTVTSTAQHVDVGLPAVTELNLYLDCGGPTGVQVQIVNDWGTGYCANVVVTNRTAAPVNWQASFPVDGTIYQFWNFTYTPAFQSITAKGVSWNQTLAAGQSTHSVGFCANRQVPPPPSVVGQMVQVTNTNDWGTGYCATLKVTNTTAAALNWNVTFPIEGTIYDFWNFTFTRSGNQITAQGVSWNRTLQPGESTHDVGFCANR